MSSGASDRGPTDLHGGGDKPAPEGSKPVERPAQPSGDTGHSDNSSTSSANIPHLAPVRSTDIATTSASPHAETSPLSYSTGLSGAPQGDFQHAASTSPMPESDLTPPPSQSPSRALIQDHGTRAPTPETRRVQDPASGSQETILRLPGRERTPTPHEKGVQTTPSLPSLFPRPVLSAADSTLSSQAAAHIRLQPESSLTRHPVYPQLHPASQEGHATSDSEVDLNPDVRRSYYRRNQPLPPLPGRMTSGPPIGVQYYDHQPSTGSIGPGMAGVGSFNNGAIGSVAGPSGRSSAPLPSNVQGPEVPLHARDDTRPTSIAPFPATTTGHTTLDRSTSRTLKSTVDWLAPGAEEKQVRERTLGERIDPTLEIARGEKDRFAAKAKITGWSLNIAIGLQVVIGAMTTGLAAATTGRQTSITTAVLGGFATIVASFLARARGSHEPELSVTRVKDLEQFIRECESFKMDFGLLRGSMYPGLDAKLDEFRGRFEELLGNFSGERRLAPSA